MLPFKAELRAGFNGEVASRFEGIVEDKGWDRTTGAADLNWV